MAIKGAASGSAGVRRGLALVAGTALVIGVLPGPARAQGSVLVQPGDTLSAIASRHGTTVAALVAANRLPSADLIYAGQRLILPRPGAITSAPAARSSAVGQVHVVRRGETLYQLAVRYGTTIGALVAANRLTSADLIYVGQRLAIPATSGHGGADAAPLPASRAGRSILIDLSDQMLYAYEGNRLVSSFLVSTGRAWTPTPVGRYRIYNRYASQRMVGPGYNLPGVPYVQYFVGNYALHGTYWHNNFGTPASHGCVNLAVPNAEWLWRWAGIGTEVVVRP